MIELSTALLEDFEQRCSASKDGFVKLTSEEDSALLHMTGELRAWREAPFVIWRADSLRGYIERGRVEVAKRMFARLTGGCPVCGGPKGEHYPIPQQGGYTTVCPESSR